MATPVVGLEAVRVNGDVVIVKGAVTYALGGSILEPVNGPTGLIGFASKGMGAFAQIESMDSQDVDLKLLQSLRNVTVTIHLQNGKTVTINDASVVGQIEVTTEDGGFTLRLEGPSGQET